MRGIEEKEVMGFCPTDYDTPRQLLEDIKLSCKELNPLLPIDENTPKDRRLNLYWPGIGWIAGSWVQLNNNVGYFIHDLLKYQPPPIKPTHYQELPADPKE
ncbi:hypothetical protein R2083_08340 [Nitrosomonas sp. Is35]|uniref:hypothetical protein n=1 Tax=Nitrosomonas sp. Is35 TaxID=3080534 RepID=UPI00294B69FA|nr:hypothetical protein [Nitrosomonas sp. Is35]MDV6347522.1 hypothetical protein [Nitrosomonas sp. Is35]